MKKLFYITLLLGGIALAKPAEAQVSVSLNIGIQPQWGPVGYDYARYYYMPEMNVYYDVSNRYYHYYDGRRWRSHRSLPSRYRHYDLYRTHKVVINESSPWRNHSHYYDRYRNYSRSSRHVAIRDGGRHYRHDRGDYKYNRKREKEHYKRYKKAEKRHHREHRGRH